MLYSPCPCEVQLLPFDTITPALNPPGLVVPVPPLLVGNVPETLSLPKSTEPVPSLSLVTASVLILSLVTPSDSI